MSDFICLLTTPSDLCWYCGEWVHVDVHGGVEGPEGRRFCAADCLDEWLALPPPRQPGDDWCDVCGFDHFDHQDWCSLAGVGPVWATRPATARVTMATVPIIG